jgi:hypothetical protein
MEVVIDLVLGDVDVRRPVGTGAALTVIVNDFGVTPPRPSLALTVTVYVPAVIGVPLMTRLLALNDNPAGKPLAV